MYIGEKAGEWNKTGEKNISIGVEAGCNNMSSENVLIGHQAGYKNGADKNVLIGTRTGYYNMSGKGNVFLGDEAGFNHRKGDHNVYLGFKAGYCNPGVSVKANQFNVFLGDEAGYNANGAEYNVFVGYKAGTKCESAKDNVFIGDNAGYAITTGSKNVCLGSAAGSKITTTSGNVFLGSNAGEYCRGSGNVFIGNKAGMTQEGVSNCLFIANNEEIPLIFGQFENKQVGINTTNTFAKHFYVQGEAGGSSGWSSASDRRLKTDIRPLEGALAKVLKLNGVSFRWKDETNHRPGNKVGFIAQEVLEVLPEVVSGGGKDEQGNELHYSIEYGSVVPVLVEAIKELKTENDMLRAGLEAQQHKIDELKRLMQQLLER